jgi:hypothetical protein
MAPIRSSTTTTQLYYNNTTKEITQGGLPADANTQSDNFTFGLNFQMTMSQGAQPDQRIWLYPGSHRQIDPYLATNPTSFGGISPPPSMAIAYDQTIIEVAAVHLTCILPAGAGGGGVGWNPASTGLNPVIGVYTFCGVDENGRPDGTSGVVDSVDYKKSCGCYNVRDPQLIGCNIPAPTGPRFLGVALDFMAGAAPGTQIPITARGQYNISVTLYVGPKLDPPPV